MKLVFWGKGKRSIDCLKSVHDKGYNIEAVIAYPDDVELSSLAEEYNIKVLKPEDLSKESFKTFLSGLNPDLFILAGYGKILSKEIIDIPKIMSINLHAGKVPEYRGSSPMNWALINGEKSFTLSILKMDSGIDSGELLLERSFGISVNDTIKDLHDTANKEFPLMLTEVLSQIEKGSLKVIPQDDSKASYYPLRFPDDGLILWDVFTAEQIHNRIRALTEPYPCAFTFFNGRKIKLLSSELNEVNYYGEPGRVYKKNKKGLFVCGLDKCLWLNGAEFEDTGEPVIDVITRYDRLATVRYSIVNNSAVGV
ncbi:MAG: methionyl-tRNA formyltransferase [Armatimonadota bacterium]